MVCKPGYYWEARNTKNLECFIRNPEMLKDFRRNGLTTGFDLSHNNLTRFADSIIKRNAKVLFPDGIPEEFIPIAEEPTIGNCYTYKLADYGINVSLASLKYVYIVQQLLEYIPNDAVIWEIGSGFGGQARAFLLTGKVKKYILQDYELQIELSKYFLKDFEDKVEVVQLNRAPWERSDLVINTHSMMEMARSEVERYFIFLNTLPKDVLFYHINFDKGSDIAVLQYPFDDNWEQVFCRGFPMEARGMFTPGKQRLYRRTR